MLNDRRRKIPIGLVQGGVGNAETAPDLRSLGRIDYQVFWLFYSANENFDDLTQFKGKRLALGPVGSGARIVCERILNKAGVTSDNSTLLYLTPEQALSALKNRTIDALFINFSPESPILGSLLRDPDFRLMSLTDAEALTRVFPYLVRIVLPRRVIDYELKIPPTDVVLIGTTNAVLVRKELHPAIIDLLTQAMVQVHSAPGVFQRTNEFPTLVDPEYTVAEEARDLLKNGPPFSISAILGYKLHQTRCCRFCNGGRYRLSAPRLWSENLPLVCRISIAHVIQASQGHRAPSERSHHCRKMLLNSRPRLKAWTEKSLLLGCRCSHSDLYFTMKSHLNLVRNRLDTRYTQLQAEAGNQLQSASRPRLRGARAGRT